MMAILHACGAVLGIGAAVSPAAWPQHLQQQRLQREAGPAERGTEPAGRDPFVRPILEAADASAPPVAGPRAEGLPGLSLDEVIVRGVLQTHGHRLAFVEAPGRKHYVLRAGDRLRDGHVEAVTDHGLVFVAHGGSPAEGARRVRRSLREHGEDR